MKKTIVGLLLIVTMFVTAACGNDPAQPTGSSNATEEFETKTFKLGHALATDHPYQKGAEFFAQRVNELTDGAVNIDIYPSSQLGGEASMLESLQMGTLDFCLTTTSVLTGFDPNMYIYDMPFLFENDDHVFAVLDGEFGQESLANLDTIGIKGLSFWECGWFGFIYNGNPIKAYTDMKATTFRTMEATLTMSWFKSLGSNPVPIAFSELFTSMQNDTVDGTILPVPTIYFNSIYTVAEHFSDIAITYSPLPLCMSKEVWDSCSPALQEVLLQAADEAKTYERQYNRDAIDEAVTDMTNQGLDVIEFTDEERQSWIDYVRDNVWSDLYNTGLVTEERVKTVLDYAQ